MTYGMAQNEHTLEQHACFTEYLQVYEDRLADYVGMCLLIFFLEIMCVFVFSYCILISILVFFSFFPRPLSLFFSFRK